MISHLRSWLIFYPGCFQSCFCGIGRIHVQKIDEASRWEKRHVFRNGKSSAKIYVKSSEGIRFRDVAGEDEAKENLSEIVEYLHNPARYKEIGASMPKGILLVGPSGNR